MEPRIQYAKTADGVSIAYWTMGDGPALVSFPPLAFSHIQLEWRDPIVRPWLVGLGRGRRLIRFDRRGSGLSQRNLTEYSREGYVMDVEAVVDHLRLERFALIASGGPCDTAVTLAARLSERVSHLVLWAPLHGFPQYPEPIEQLREDDWELFTENLAHVTMGWSRREAHYFAKFMRESTTQQDFALLLEAARAPVEAGLLADVRCPTLVLYPRRAEGPGVDADVAAEIAAGIPSAQLMFIETKEIVPFLADADIVLRAIEDFLGESAPSGAQSNSPTAGLATIFFTDIADSTGLTQRLGDAKAQELVRAHNGIVREALGAHGGTEIKHTGDGIMASFPTASGALECAVAIQRGVADRDVGAHGHAPLQVHIGLNAGEPVAEEHDLFGTSVQLARRICDTAAGGEILASDVVRQLAAGKGFLFSDRGVVPLKGFDEPVRLYEVRWREE